MPHPVTTAIVNRILTLRCQQIVTWLESYVAHFGFGDHIHLGVMVSQVTPLQGGGYAVTIVTSKTETFVMTRIYAAVIVASGHHWDPLWPKWPGHFSGNMTHSHFYRSPAPFAGKRVVVVGVGNSGLRFSTIAHLRHACRRDVLNELVAVFKAFCT